jgi:hypothetical protein
MEDINIVYVALGVFGLFGGGTIWLLAWYSGKQKYYHELQVKTLVEQLLSALIPEGDLVDAVKDLEKEFGIQQGLALALATKLDTAKQHVEALTEDKDKADSLLVILQERLRLFKNRQASLGKTS